MDTFYSPHLVEVPWPTLTFVFFFVKFCDFLINETRLMSGNSVNMSQMGKRVRILR